MMNIETTLHLIGEYMNLIQACDEIGAEERPNFSERLSEHRATINSYLGGLGYSEDDIDEVWSGESQLTSS